MRRSLTAIAIALLTSCALTSPGISTSITSVNVELPQHINWSVVSDDADNSQYLKEWVPEGENPVTSKWMISEQILTLDSKTSAKLFQKQLYILSKKGCTDAWFNGPQEIVVGGYKTSVGRIMCANQLGKSYGTFTDQRVVIDGLTAYVVTSELRTPPSRTAGVIAFDEEQFIEREEFMSLQRMSSELVRNSVKIQLQ